MMLNERELSEIHQKLADWVDQAEEADDTDRPPEQLIDDVRNALSAVSEERAHRRTMLRSIPGRYVGYHFGHPGRE